jgi:hypothetical protein
MFFRRLCGVGAAIVGGLLIAGWLVIGSLDQDRGGRRAGSMLSLIVGGDGNGDAKGAGPDADNGTESPTRFPPLVDFPVVGVRDAAPEVRDEDYVVGVELDGESRAYPLNMLSRPERHVLNDTLGGRPIAVTWCGLCQSPIVFARQAKGRTLVLFVPGGVYGENMAIQDVETGSRWAQMLGEAMDGPLKGESLEQLPSVWTDWKTWRTEHPGTTVLKLSHTIDYYRHDPDRSGTSPEQRYLSSLQWGLARGGKALSWPLKELFRQPVVNDSLAGLPLLIFFDAESATLTAFERRVGDDTLTFRKVPDGLADDRTGSVWDPVTGRAIRGAFAGRRLTPVPGVISHLRAWRTFHPESESRTAHPT